MGGVSSERDISLKGGRAVHQALTDEGYQAVEIDIQSENKEDVVNQIMKCGIDCAFLVLHGKFGEDGGIQSILEELDIPYTGSGVAASQIAINKLLTQNLLKKNGIAIPKYVNVTKQDRDTLLSVISILGDYPLVVKPASEGSSIGTFLVANEQEYLEKSSKAFEYDQELIVEQYIQGRELTVGILDQQVLPVLEIKTDQPFFNFDAKYTQGITEYIVPAPLDDEVAKRVSDIALKVHHIVGCQDLSRVDLILNERMEPFVLEINTIPGFTQTSLVPKAAACVGINFHTLCKRLVELAYGKKKEENKV